MTGKGLRQSRSGSDMRKKNKTTQVKFFSCFMKAPMRFLIMAKEFYIQGMCGCTGRHLDYAAAFGCPTGQIAYSLPRSFSGSYRDDVSNTRKDFNDLMKAAASRSFRKNQIKELQPVAMLGSTKVVPKDDSTGSRLAKIDEDNSCED